MSTTPKSLVALGSGVVTSTTSSSCRHWPASTATQNSSGIASCVPSTRPTDSPRVHLLVELGFARLTTLASPRRCFRRASSRRSGRGSAARAGRAPSRRRSAAARGPRGRRGAGFVLAARGARERRLDRAAGGRCARTRSSAAPCRRSGTAACAPTAAEERVVVSCATTLPPAAEVSERAVEEDDVHLALRGARRGRPRCGAWPSAGPAPGRPGSLLGLAAGLEAAASRRGT